jgi:PIN domain nuclease of toxin-antitoxin system
MRLLLDTHAFIWWDSDPAKLSAVALGALRDPASTVWLSSVSVWEMIIKAQLGRLSLRLPLPDIVAQQQVNGLQVLPVTLPHVLAIEGLPPVHKDPFDRLLMAQVIVEGAEFVSSDQVFRTVSSAVAVVVEIAAYTDAGGKSVGGESVSDRA